MTCNEVIQMEDLPNPSLKERCSSVVSLIKQDKENRSQFPYRTNCNVIQHELLGIKRQSINELDSIRTARKKSFSNWPHSIPTPQAMSTNGWYYCNTNDRALCLYCNTICHNWTETDDPYEVHARLAPECPFILSLPSSSKDQPSMITHNPNETFQPRHTNMCEVARRLETFNNKNWTQTSPNIDDLAYAGFFYTGNGTTVTCFYCNGSLHKWGQNDNPKVEHCRWFSDCLYAKHLCGARLHGKILMKKKELAIEKKSFDTDTISRLVNARLDLPVVERLRKRYRLSIIKRCIEDQFKNNHDDFQTDQDLTMACFILQKQIEIIQGNADRLITPSQNQVSIDIPETTKRKAEECVICLTEERQVACMPCGHLSTCVSCGYALRSCPICRVKIQSFVRIYC